MYRKGALQTGYIIVSPREHVKGIRAAVKGPDGARFARFLVEVVEWYSYNLGPFTFWEHGGADVPLSRQSACVAHAHAHLVLGYISLSEPRGGASFSDVDQALEWLAQIPGFIPLGWA